MISVLAEAETALIATLDASFGSAVKTVEGLPSKLDDAALDEWLTLAPGIFVAFMSAPRKRAAPVRQAHYTTRWGVYCLVAHAGGETSRRIGDAGTTGGYAMAEMAARVLDGEELLAADQSKLGEMQSMAIDSLWSRKLSAKGRALFGVTIELPLELGYGVDADSLADFLHAHTEFQMPDTPENPDQTKDVAMTDDLTLQT